jgi:hypothetical protein
LVDIGERYFAVIGEHRDEIFRYEHLPGVSVESGAELGQALDEAHTAITSVRQMGTSGKDSSALRRWA